MFQWIDKIPRCIRKINTSIRHLITAIGYLAYFFVLATLLAGSNVLFTERVEQVRVFTRQIEFDFVTWTIQAIAIKWEQNALEGEVFLAPKTRSDVVLSYLDLVRQINQVESEIHKIYADPHIPAPQEASAGQRAELNRLISRRDALAPFVETALQLQLSEVLADMGLTMAGQPMPPVLYHVTDLPNALIVSPREIIREDANIMIHPDMSLAQIVRLEDDVAHGLNVSSLVEEVGGVGLYPTMVMQVDDVTALANVVAHEWTHNYLTLHPLGLSYDVSPAMRTINETTASIAGKEIGLALVARFYPDRLPPEEPASSPPKSEKPSGPPVFNYNKEMHTTRLNTDALLNEGKIAEAEDYMEMRRKFFWENGYAIRKLNQAYFAFHGAYADVPEGAAGKDPVGEAVRTLRNRSPSLTAFLGRIAWMSSLEQLMEAVHKP
jgi:hypothetical protein